MLYCYRENTISYWQWLKCKIELNNNFRLEFDIHLRSSGYLKDFSHSGSLPQSCFFWHFCDRMFLYKLAFSGKPTTSRFWTQTRSKCLSQSQMGFISNCILNWEDLSRFSLPLFISPWALHPHFWKEKILFSCWGKSRELHIPTTCWVESFLSAPRSTSYGEVECTSKK